MSLSPSYPRTFLHVMWPLYWILCGFLTSLIDTSYPGSGMPLSLPGSLPILSRGQSVVTAMVPNSPPTPYAVICLTAMRCRAHSTICKDGIAPWSCKSVSVGQRDLRHTRSSYTGFRSRRRGPLAVTRSERLAACDGILQV